MMGFSIQSIQCRNHPLFISSLHVHISIHKYIIVLQPIHPSKGNDFNVDDVVAKNLSRRRSRRSKMPGQRTEIERESFSFTLRVNINFIPFPSSSPSSVA